MPLINRQSFGGFVARFGERQQGGCSVGGGEKGCGWVKRVLQCGGGVAGAVRASDLLFASLSTCVCIVCG